MDNLRGVFDASDPVGDDQDWDAHEEDVARDLPPAAIGQDERRMQVRAYNHWAGLLGESTFPSIEDLEPHNLNDFGPNSVLLDFSVGVEDPAVQYLGAELAEECGTDGSIKQLSDVPPRSLLSRITDHYMQILANQAPIGFEAEFVNQRGASIMYRGILLPFSSNDETIDFIYGVINWKEIADQVTSDELLLEIDQALELDEEPVEDEDEPQKHHADPFVAGPSADIFELGTDATVPNDAPGFDGSDFIGSDFKDNVASLGAPMDTDYHSPRDEDDLPLPDFGQYSLDDPDADEDEDEDDSGAGYSFASLADYIETPVKKAVDLDADHFDAADYKAEYADGDAEDDELGSAEYAPLSEDPSEEEMLAPKAKQPLDLSGFDEPEAAVEPDEHAVLDPADGGHTPIPQTGDESFEIEAAQAEPPIENSEPELEPEFAPELAPYRMGQTVIALDEPELGDDAGLYDFLASARELASAANTAEDRSRSALYAAVGRAYDFSLAAKAEPDDYRELLEESGLSVQDRAPMTPIVKLVFGSNYDKTRLTEYAAVLAHAHRHDLERGSLAEFLEEADGGLKGVVAAERRIRREEAGKKVEAADEVRRALAEKLRELEELTFEALSGDGAEFSIVVVRRDGDGGVSMLGEIDDDIPMIERAAKKLVG